MNIMKVSEVIELLEENGWEFLRCKGDHRSYGKQGQPRPIIVPGKKSADVPIGTLQSILRQAGLKNLA